MVTIDHLHLDHHYHHGHHVYSCIDLACEKTLVRLIYDNLVLVRVLLVLCNV